MLHISWTPKSSHQKDDLVCQLMTEFVAQTTQMNEIENLIT